eukprot:6650182-Prymnesium_polylepis.1
MPWAGTGPVPGRVCTLAESLLRPLRLSPLSTPGAGGGRVPLVLREAAAREAVRPAVDQAGRHDREEPQGAARELPGDRRHQGRGGVCLPKQGAHRHAHPFCPPRACQPCGRARARREKKRAAATLGDR